MRLGPKLLLVLVSLVVLVTAVVLPLVRWKVSDREERRINEDIGMSLDSFDLVRGEYHDRLAIQVPQVLADPDVVATLRGSPEDVFPVCHRYLVDSGYGSADRFAALFTYDDFEDVQLLLYPPPPGGVPTGPAFDFPGTDHLTAVRTLLEDPTFQAALGVGGHLWIDEPREPVARRPIVHGGRLFEVQAVAIRSVVRGPSESPEGVLYLIQEVDDEYVRRFILSTDVAACRREEAVRAAFVVGDRVVGASDDTLPGLAGLAGALGDVRREAREPVAFALAGSEYRGIWAREEADGVGFVVFRSYSHAIEPLRQLLRFLFVASAGIVLVAVLLAFAITRQIVRPVGRLVEGTEAVEGGDLEVEVAVTTSDEIGHLTRSFNRMVAELRLKERIKDQFGKYVDPKIVENLIADPDAAKMGGDKRVMTVFFSDVAGFTSLAEQMEAEALVDLLNEYLTRMSKAIVDREGVIDKYIGDAIMAFWGPPFVAPGDHARLACLSALEQRARLEEFQADLARRGLPSIDVRMGIATGEMIVGNVGSETSRGYTVMGDRVNLAARLESANKQFGTRILIDEETARAAGAAIEVREIDRLRVKGKEEPVTVFELLAPAGALDPGQVRLREAYQEALAAYRRQDWDRAAEALSVGREQADRPTGVLLGRIEQLRRKSPEPDWSGVWSLEEK